MAYDGNAKIVQFGNIVGLWHLDDDVTASSINENDGTLEGGATYTSGLWGTSALDFDGSSGYVEVGNTNIPVGSNSISLSAWVINKGNGAGGGGISCAFGIGTGTTDNTHLAFCHYPNSNFFIGHWGADDWITGVNLPQNVWEHIAYTYDGSTEKIYLNGVEVDSRLHTFSISASPTVRIGDWDDKASTNYYWGGVVEDAAIWDSALSEQQIQELFSKGASRIGIEYRGCDNANCSDGEWSAPTNYSIGTLISATSVLNKRYFQYKIFPELYTFEGSQQYPNAYPKYADLNFVYIN